MKKNKILVVEDDRSIGVLLDHILSESYETKIVSNGYDALAGMQKGNIPDLIITDLSMPKMGGNDLMRNLKTSSFFKQIPIMVLSASDKSSERIHCLKNGANDYLIKPFNPEELLIRINNMLAITQATI